MSKKVYCGAGNVPKDSKRGTALECILKNQHRFYGITELSPDILEDAEAYKTEFKELKKTRTSLKKQYVSLTGTIAGIKRRFNFAKKQDEKDELRAEGIQKIKEKNAIVDKYEAVLKKLKKYGV